MTVNSGIPDETIDVILGDRVSTPWVEGMASQNSPEREANPSKGPVALHRFVGVLRAGGLESTMRTEKWRNPPLIGTDHPHQQKGDTIKCHGPSGGRLDQAWSARRGQGRRA